MKIYDNLLGLITIGLIVLVGTHLIYRLYSLEMISAPTEVSNRSNQSVKAYPNGGATNLTLNSQRNLFGYAVDNDDIEVNQSYILKGISFPPLNPADAIAVINSGTGEDNVYRIGDKLSTKTIIKNILSDKVIILDNGKLEQLTIDWDNAQHKTTTSTPESTQRKIHPKTPDDFLPTLENMIKIRSDYIGEIIPVGEEYER